MSIASEINRLLQAKSDLATSIANKGVTVPAATTLDGYAALVDQIQQGGGTLPYDAEVEYLESTGTQYINCGAKSGANVIFIVDGNFTSYPNTDYNFGCMGSKANSRYHFGIFSSNFIFGIGTKYKNTIAADTNRHLFILNGNGETKLDNNIQLNTTFSGTSYDITLFARNVVGTIDTFCNFRLYNSQISVSNTIVRDFIPVRKGTVGYLYDRISGLLFGNFGTGNFILGADKN